MKNNIKFIAVLLLIVAGMVLYHNFETTNELKPIRPRGCELYPAGLQKDTCTMGLVGIHFKKVNDSLYYTIDGKYFIKYGKSEEATNLNCGAGCHVVRLKDGTLISVSD